MSLECRYYLHCWLVEGVKKILVCVIDQLSDHFGIRWYGHMHIKNFWTLSTNLQSLYLYTKGKFSASAVQILHLAVIDVIKN